MAYLIHIIKYYNVLFHTMKCSRFAHLRFLNRITRMISTFASALLRTVIKCIHIFIKVVLFSTISCTLHPSLYPFLPLSIFSLSHRFIFHSLSLFPYLSISPPLALCTPSYFPMHFFPHLLIPFVLLVRQPG